MILTDFEKAMFDGAHGAAKRRAMDLLVWQRTENLFVTPTAAAVSAPAHPLCRCRRAAAPG
jgi:hypothetical protein